jgi:cytoskeletal protein CcmA (bactofilin family)
VFDLRPRSGLRPLPPRETAALLRPALVGTIAMQPALVVAIEVDPRWRGPEVRIERLRFAGVWTGALPKRSPIDVLVYFVAALMGVALVQRLTGATARAMRVRRADAALDPPVRAPARAAASAPAAIAKPRARSSFIGPDLQIQGYLISTSDVHVEGQIDGDCVCRQLVIKSAGRLTGDALAEEVIVSGAVEGRILAKTVGLTSRAVVSGDINYCDLIVERQATIEARMQRISRACWDVETAAEQPRMIAASPRAVA